MKLNNKFSLIAVSLIGLLFLTANISSLSIRKGETELEADSQRHRTGHKNKHAIAATSSASVEAKQIPGPTFNATNNTLSASLYNSLNNTFVTQGVSTFKIKNRRWNDNKMSDKQLEDIYRDLITNQQTSADPAAYKAAIQIFVSQFESCDGNHDNVLNLTEFQTCMVNDTYLNQITPPPQIFATYANYSFTNSTGFYPILYNVIDSFRLNYTNFHDYMLLRLMVFSWRKCSVMAPFIEESAFECAIEISAGWKTMTRNTARHLYSLALELSNTFNVRNIDFITYYIVAQSARLYGKVNGKEDSDATLAEFNLALDGNILPGRYNQEVIDSLFRLTKQSNHGVQGIDLLSFVFYDFSLRLFDIPNAQRRWRLNRSEFTGIFNNYLFPNGTLQEVQSIPQNNLTAVSYQMYTYLNISNYHQEADHFLKFAQVSEKSRLEKAVASIGPIGNQTFNLNSTASQLFNIFDNDRDGFLTFYDFGNFMQIAYLFNLFDSFRNGRIVAGNLHERYTKYSELPTISEEMRSKAKRFDLFPQDLYFNLQIAAVVLRIDDTIKTVVRRTDITRLTEIELKNTFNYVGLAFVPDAYLNKCLMGTSDKHIPLYDWECAFIQAVTVNAEYLESSQSYLITKLGNLTLVNTKFVNVDPAIK